MIHSESSRQGHTRRVSGHVSMANLKLHSWSRPGVWGSLVGTAVCVTVLVIARSIKRDSEFKSGRYHVMEQKTSQSADRDQAIGIERDHSCQPFILYDKPVKTGSTAMRKAILKYLGTIAEEEVVCASMFECSDMTEEICLGRRSPAHLVHHLLVNTSRTTCLHEKGYYHVTSIRKPEARIVSAFKYNRAQRATYNGIPYNVTFEEFLARYPRCALYHYYDRLGCRCKYDEKVLKARAEDIANRMDEVVELEEAPISDLHKRIHKFLKRANVVSLEGANEFHVPNEVSKTEYVLYNTLKEKRASLARHPRKKLCGKQNTLRVK